MSLKRKILNQQESCISDSPACEILNSGLRVALFRLVPDLAVEEDLIRRFTDILSPENVAIFKVFGHYDLMIIYGRNNDSKMLYSGSVHGIRSYSFIDCLCWADHRPAQVLHEINSARVLSASFFSLTDSCLTAHGGLRNKKVAESAGQDGLYLNSMAWGEQILIFPKMSMSDLFNTARTAFDTLMGHSLDMHPLIGVNIDTVRVIDKNLSEWTEEILPSLDIEWEIEFSTDSDSAGKFLGVTLLVAKELSGLGKFEISANKYSFSKNSASYKINATNWTTLIGGIRKIRQKCGDSLRSTRLKIWSEDLISEVERSAEPERQSAELIPVTQKDCDEIQNIHGPRVSMSVLQAIYTVSDAILDCPADIALKSLIPATRELLNFAKRDNPLPNDYITIETISPLKQSQACLSRAERILTATKQRLAGLPMTRESSRVPFEIPPPSPRIYYEACEFVISKFLLTLGEKGYPFITIDEVDGPEFYASSVNMPSHRLNELSIYTALTHESLHYFSKRLQNDELHSEPVVNFYVHGGPVIFGNRNVHRVRFVEEIFVEALDYFYSYLSDFNVYMQQEWSFWDQLFKLSYRKNLSPQEILPYLLRTLAVRIIAHCKATKLMSISSSTNIPKRFEATHLPSRIISIPHVLREIIREHICEAKAILKDRDSHLIRVFTPALVVKMQFYMEQLKDVMDSIYSLVNKIILEKPDVIDEMQAWRCSDEFKGLICQIRKGIVTDKIVRYPHLIVHGLSQELSQKKDNEAAICKALLISIWNASKHEKIES